MTLEECYNQLECVHSEEYGAEQMIKKKKEKKKHSSIDPCFIFHLVRHLGNHYWRIFISLSFTKMNYFELPSDPEYKNCV